MNCCEFYYNICNPLITCEQITLTIPNLPIGDYRIEYYYPFQTTLHYFDVEVFDVDTLVLPNRFNNNYIYFRIFDLTNNVYISQTINVNGIDKTTDCYKFFNQKIIAHAYNQNKELCQVPETKMWIYLSISNLYNFNLRYIQFCDIFIDLNDYNGVITSVDGTDLLDQFFTLITSNVDLQNFLFVNGIEFTREDTLIVKIEVNKEEMGCCCDKSKLQFLTESGYNLFGSQSEAFCCGDDFKVECVDGGILRKGTAYFTLPLCDDGEWTSGPSCLPEEGATTILSNYCFNDYIEMANYINTQNLNANAEPWENGIIVTLDFGQYNSDISIIGLELYICRDGVSQYTTFVNGCPDIVP